MDFDELQQTWQSQDTEPMITVEPTTLLKMVERNKITFELQVFWRDVHEVGVAVVLAILFGYWGTKGDGWPWFVLGGLVMFVGVFMVVDRFLQKKKKPVLSRPLTSCIESSLNQVNHQIWLVRNVFWWYLLPPGAGIVLVFGCLVRPLSRSVLSMFLCAALFAGIYWLNQRAVRKELLPRKEELEAMLTSLEANEAGGLDTTGGV
jgi:hypothetical protein